MSGSRLGELASPHPPLGSRLRGNDECGCGNDECGCGNEECGVSWRPHIHPWVPACAGTTSGSAGMTVVCGNEECGFVAIGCIGMGEVVCDCGE